MIYNGFQELSLSRLGFGTMRLPLIEGTKTIDKEQVKEMVRLAIDGGINYFDTAYPYHGGESERVIGEVLKAYPRDSYYLATKYPGHQIAETYDPKAIFEEQLQKCGVDYFDFYLLHNVCENSMNVYLDERWGIIDYFMEQKKRGRIRHLGFSSHGRVENLREFLDLHGDKMEFCQIQMNYLDWTLQEAKEKYELLSERNIPVWVMEPVRGGKLANLSDYDSEKLKALRADETNAAWAFRFLQDLPNVKMVLSGMSNIAQMKENIDIFKQTKPLLDTEREVLLSIAEKMKNSLPCTGCGYCKEGCPMGLNIPLLISSYNEAKFGGGFTVGMMLDSLPEEQKPSACVGCGACSEICPQKIDVPAAMADFNEVIKTLPNWTQICKERAEAAKKGKA
ncbi:MAG: aldo/keto reductase [Clostridia bacterium]|nr:aldo/keto reductase [Clostridia bacterium]